MWIGTINRIESRIGSSELRIEWFGAKAEVSLWRVGHGDCKLEFLHTLHGDDVRKIHAEIGWWLKKLDEEENRLRSL